jgi:hypothetical protein
MWFGKKTDDSARTENDALRDANERLERERGELLDKVLHLEERAKKAELDRQMTEDEIKHMVKLKTEREEVAFQKREMELKAEHQAEIHRLQREYADKVEKDLKAQIDRMQDMYGEVLARLPNITAKLGGNVGG